MLNYFKGKKTDSKLHLKWYTPVMAKEKESITNEPMRVPDDG